MDKFTKADVARKYRDKYGMKMATSKLARIMYDENKLLFNKIENARSILRYIEGKYGKEAKEKISNHPQTSKYLVNEHRTTNPYNLPSSDESSFEPYILKGHKAVGILSDVHVPYHSIEALTIAIQYLKSNQIDALILNGDTIDCHRLSKYVKDPRKRDFKLELDTFKALIEVLQRELNCKIYFKVGNHEERYEKFLLEKAHELKGVEEFEFENIIKARANGIEFITDKRPIIANGLYILHGHEFMGGGGVNPAKSLFNKAKTFSCQGHNHVTGFHEEKSLLTGESVFAYSMGCLSELHPAYMPLNRWNHGFGMLHLDDSSFIFENKRIFNGNVI